MEGHLVDVVFALLPREEVFVFAEENTIVLLLPRKDFFFVFIEERLLF